MEQLLSVLPPLCGVPRLWVAYSGGCDSHVLLHALWQLRDQLPPISVIHIDHGLQAESAAWAGHCQRVCEALGLDCVVQRVDAQPRSGKSPEDIARHARYQAFSDVAAEDELVCLAHHQDDQAETFLLQLLRGAGPKGLGAMAVQSCRLSLTLIRPLLAFSREELEAYARDNGLKWIDDPSNAETDYRRNFLRHRIFPTLKARWPAANKVIARSAAHCAEAAEMLEDLASQDFEAVMSFDVACLSVERLLMLSVARQKNVLRYWLRRQGLPLPSEAKLRHVMSDVLRARVDGQSCVRWSGGEVRRFRGDLYAQRPVEMLQCVTFGAILEYGVDLDLPDGSVLHWKEGLSHLAIDFEKLTNKELVIRYRQGSETCRPAGQPHRRSLKNLFQEAGVAPWLRDRCPLVYAGDELVAIVGVCVADGWQSEFGVGWEWMR